MHRKTLAAAAVLSAAMLLFHGGRIAELHAATLTAASGSAADIQAAVDQAQPGDTVLIPEGAFDFDGQVVAPDGIAIRGMGRDRTVLIKHGDLGDWEGMFMVDCQTGAPFVFSDITLLGSGRFVQGNSKERGPVRDQGLYLRGGCTDFQVHDSRFSKFTRAGILVRANTGSAPGDHRGVIYGNEFIDNWYPNLGYGVEVIGHQDSWDDPLALGTVDAIVIEDNLFELNRHTVASANGARYVFRNNLIRNNYPDAAAIDAHGLAAWPRGTRSYEIYGNTVQNAERRWAGIGLRGGDGVVFNNRLEGVSHGVVLMIERFERGMRYPVQDQIRDIWIWDNTVDGKKQDKPSFAKFQKRASKLIKKRRNYHLAEKPDYEPLTYPHPLRTQD